MEKIKVHYDSFYEDKKLSWGLVWEDIDPVLWFPKSECTINRKEKSIEMPSWLYQEKLAEYD